MYMFWFWCICFGMEVKIGIDKRLIEKLFHQLHQKDSILHDTFTFSLKQGETRTSSGLIWVPSTLNSKLFVTCLTLNMLNQWKRRCLTKRSALGKANSKFVLKSDEWHLKFCWCKEKTLNWSILRNIVFYYVLTTFSTSSLYFVKIFFYTLNNVLLNRIKEILCTFLS